MPMLTLMKSIRALLFGLCATLSPAAQAEGIDIPVSVEVLPGWRTADGTHMTAISIELGDGWKTYWRAPGDAGIPPRISWAGSENVDGAAMHWPVPEIFESAGMQTIGYHGSVVIPMELRTPDAGADATLRGTLEIGVCDDICVPVSVPFDLVLPGDARRRSPEIAAALIDRPLTGAEAGAGPVTCQIAPTDDGLRLTASVQIPAGRGEEIVVMETADPEIWVSGAATSRDGNRLTASADLVHLAGAPMSIDRSGLRFTILSDGTAVDLRGCAAG